MGKDESYVCYPLDSSYGPHTLPGGNNISVWNILRHRCLGGHQLGSECCLDCWYGPGP